MAVLKALTSGGKRRELDFYQTPPEATLALLPLIEHWPSRVWEPCCGDGAISKVLEQHGREVFSSDLVDRGWGMQADFFKLGIQGTSQRTIITNPPFGRAGDFIRHAHAIGVERMALLLKVNFWSVKSRMSLFAQWRPYLIAPLTWRLDFTGAGSPHTDCMWCLWDATKNNTETEFEPLARP